jgi:hypothetical protein
MVRSLHFVFVSALLVASPAWGHHSHAMYESDLEVTLVGTVHQLQWSNPHVFLYLVVEDENGETSNWALEGGSPSALLRQGWPSGDPKPGDEVTVTVRPLKVGRGGLIRTVTFADNSEFIYRGGPESSLQCNRPGQ